MPFGFSPVAPCLKGAADNFLQPRFEYVFVILHCEKETSFVLIYDKIKFPYTDQALDIANCHAIWDVIPQFHGQGGVYGTVSYFHNAVHNVLSYQPQRTASLQPVAFTDIHTAVRRAGPVFRHIAVERRRSPRHFHMHILSNRHRRPGHNGNARRQRTATGHIFTHKQHNGGHNGTVPILTDREHRHAHSHVDSHHSHEGDAADTRPADNRTRAPTHCAQSPCGRSHATIAVVLHMGSVAIHRGGPSRKLRDERAVGKGSRNDSDSAMLACGLLPAVLLRTTHRPCLRRQDSRRSGARAKKHRTCHMDGANLSQPHIVDRAGRLRGVAKHHKLHTALFASKKGDKNILT